MTDPPCELSGSCVVKLPLLANQLDPLGADLLNRKHTLEMEGQSLRADKCSDMPGILPDWAKDMPKPEARLATTSAEWNGLFSVKDLVMLAPGVCGSDVLRWGEVGQVIRDERQGQNPYQVRGQRGNLAWFCADALVPCTLDRCNRVCDRGHLLRDFGYSPSLDETVTCSRCLELIPPLRRRWQCDSSKKCNGYSICHACYRSSAHSNSTVSLEPLMQQVVRALDPEAHIDFPKITSICEAAAKNPSGASMATALLVAALAEQELKPGDIRNITQDYLKVLTIINEMLYESELVAVLRSTPGLKPALDQLRVFRQGNMGDATDENIRMLANEVEKAVFQSPVKPCDLEDVIAFCPRGHPLRYKPGQSMFHVHYRHCAMCGVNILRTMARFNCRECNLYDVCIDCIERGT